MEKFEVACVYLVYFSFLIDFKIVYIPNDFNCVFYLFFVARIFLTLMRDNVVGTNIVDPNDDRKTYLNTPSMCIINHFYSFNGYS